MKNKKKMNKIKRELFSIVECSLELGPRAELQQNGSALRLRWVIQLYSNTHAVIDRCY